MFSTTINYLVSQQQCLYAYYLRFLRVDFRIFILNIFIFIFVYSYLSISVFLLNNVTDSLRSLKEPYGILKKQSRLVEADRIAQNWNLVKPSRAE